MTTQRISAINHAAIPDNSGDVFFEPYSVKATNDVWGHLVAIFNESSARVGLRGMFSVPYGFVGDAKIVVVWTSTATSGDVEWDFDYRAVGGNDTESLDQSGVQESVNAAGSAPSAAHERLEATLALTSSNLAEADTVEFEIFRDGTDAGDTMAASAIVFDVQFEYSS